MRDARVGVADRWLCGRVLHFSGIGTRIVGTDSSIRESAHRISERSARISGEVARMGDGSQCISGSDLLIRGSCSRMHGKQARIGVRGAGILGIDQTFRVTALLIGGAAPN